MMAGAAALMFDPIFQGMAISLLFGALIATTLTLIVVPLGCVSAAGSFDLCTPQVDDAVACDNREARA
jgi:hypothetical protein